MMRASLFLLAWVSVCTAAMAGGPSLEMEDAEIHEVVRVHGGVVLRVSGVVKILTSKVEGDEPEGGNGKWVTLPMEKGEVRYLGGELYSLSLSGRKSYEERIEALAGTTEHLQMWGTTVILHGGQVSQITARLVGALMPGKGERAFDTGRLGEIVAEDD